MADQFAIFVDGGIEADLSGVDSQRIKRAASRAINRITRDTRSEIADEVRRQLNVPARYVGPNKDRLFINQLASPSSLESEIIARGRATSLARFVSGSRRPGRTGVTVNIQSGASAVLKRAFLIPLRRGLGDQTDGPKNLGLAIRLRPGESLSGTTAARRLGSNLFLLYGPSVAQVFEANAGSGVKRDISPETARRLSVEFLRLLEGDGLV